MPPISESMADHNSGNYVPYFFASLLGSLMSPTTQYREDTRDGANGFSSSSEKTRMSNRLQMS